jgi:D-serine deaminase-like pyridoxal phosphate-dependent protein
MAGDWYRIANEDEVPSPALLIYPERIARNIDRTIAQAGGPDRLRPHVKTHKLPQVVRMFVDRGVWRFKAATIAEAEMTAAAGGRDVLLAYPAVGPAAVRLAELVLRFPQSRFHALADSDRGVADLAAAAAARGVVLDVLVDLDVGMHRTGVAAGPAAAAVYRKIATTPGLTPGGLHAYDGHLHAADHEQLRAAVAAAFAPVWHLRDELLAAGLPVPLVVASGTPTFPILAEHPGVEVGAGTTVLWDAGQPELSPDLDFLNAAVLLVRVVSRPTPDRLCLDLGHKAVASEMPHPRVRIFGLEDATFPVHSEEHLVVQTPRAAAFPEGTVLYALPRHVCPTVALHAEVVVVDQGRAVDRWPVTARARRLTV